MAESDAPDLETEGRPVPGCLLMLIDNTSIDAGDQLADEAAAVLTRHQWSNFKVGVEPKPAKSGWPQRFKRQGGPDVRRVSLLL